mgnify:CR=1 FL=1
MEKIAIPCADLEMTNLVIILVMLMGIKSVLMGGKKILKTQKETTVPKVSILIFFYSFTTGQSFSEHVNDFHSFCVKKSIANSF